MEQTTIVVNYINIQTSNSKADLKSYMKLNSPIEVHYFISMNW